MCESGSALPVMDRSPVSAVLKKEKEKDKTQSKTRRSHEHDSHGDPAKRKTIRKEKRGKSGGFFRLAHTMAVMAVMTSVVASVMMAVVSVMSVLFKDGQAEKKSQETDTAKSS